MTMMSIFEADTRLTASGQMFEIDEAVIRGVPTKIWKNAPATLADILKLSRAYGERTFIVYEDERLSFEQHFRAAAHFAHVLQDRFGVGQGDRVSIAMRNLPEWSVAFWGAAAAGAVVVPLNAWWTGEELHFGLADSETKVLVADAERAARIAPHLPDLPDLEASVVVGSRGGAPAGMLSWEETLGQIPDQIDVPAVSVAADDDATIFYTSGTTGRPKGA
ncbi:MAG TPA: class I adenylate-forming enzyme family protein, partial [Acidimicrobiales bacterium]|nr:class I adenylate-forming enzyme family protein [Acidimicrobiales bacterium]